MNTITAKVEHALRVKLSNGGDALLIQDGPTWNGLASFKCVHPEELAGGTLVAMPDAPGWNGAFASILEGKENWNVVLASPSLAVAIPGLVNTK